MGHSLSHIDLFLNKLSLIFRNYSRALISTYNNTPLSCTYNVVNFFYEQAAKLTLLAAFSKKNWKLPIAKFQINNPTIY